MNKTMAAMAGALAALCITGATYVSPIPKTEEPGLLVVDDPLPAIDRPGPGTASFEALEEWGRGYTDGTSFADQYDYARLYATTSDREIRFVNHVVEGDAVITLYEAKNMDTGTGEARTERGVAVFHFKDGKPYVEEHASVTAHEFDLGVTGQLADVGTTAAGLAQGFAEGNPALSGLGSAGMAGAGVLKIWMAKRADNYGIIDCIAWKQTTAGFGWGAAVWNVGVLAALNPMVGAVAGIAAAMYTSDRQNAMRTCALAKLEVQRKLAVSAEPAPPS